MSTMQTPGRPPDKVCFMLKRTIVGATMRTGSPTAMSWVYLSCLAIRNTRTTTAKATAPATRPPTATIIRRPPPQPPYVDSLNPLSRVLLRLQAQTHSAVGPRKHQVTGMPNDDSSGCDVLKDHL